MIWSSQTTFSEEVECWSAAPNERTNGGSQQFVQIHTLSHIIKIDLSHSNGVRSDLSRFYTHVAVGFICLKDRY